MLDSNARESLGGIHYCQAGTYMHFLHTGTRRQLLNTSRHTQTGGWAGKLGTSSKQSAAWIVFSRCLAVL